MGEGFKKFKNRLMLKAIFKSILCTLSLGLLIAGLFIVAEKQNMFSFRLPVSVAVSVGSAVVFGLVWFICLRPTNAKTARKIDRALSFKEKAQTMLAYAGVEGDMVELQRNDTEEKLRALSASRLGFTDMIKYIPALFIALALFITSLLLPAKAEEPPYVEPPVPFEISEWQLVALRELINDVQASELRQDAKEETVVSLEELLRVLGDTDTRDEMKTEVVGTIADVTESINNVNSYRKINASLRNGDNSEILYGIIGTPGNPLPQSGRQSFFEAMTFETVDETITALKAVVSESKSALKSVYREGSDELADTIYALIDALNKYCEESTAQTVDEVIAQISAVIDGSASDIETAFYAQGVNEDVRDMVVNELMRIFGISSAELPPDLFNQIYGSGSHVDEDYEEKEDEEDKQMGDGGAGSGDIIYGSNDNIFDYDENKHILYSDVMAEYWREYDRMHDAGMISDEIYEYLKNYYAALGGTLDKE